MVKISAAAAAAVALTAAVAVAPSQVEASYGGGFGTQLDWSDCEGFGFSGKWNGKTWVNRYYCGKRPDDGEYCYQKGSSARISDFWCDQLTQAFLNNGHPKAPGLKAWKLKAPHEGYITEVTCYKKDGSRQKEVYKLDDAGQPTGEITKSGKCWPHDKPVFSLDAYPDWNFNEKNPRDINNCIGRIDGLLPKNAEIPKTKEWKQCYFDHEKFTGFHDAECEDGYVCARVNQWFARCMEDPAADHECCHGENEWGCDPGTCCAGMKCLIDENHGHNRCVRHKGTEPSTGIPGCTADPTAEKSVKSIYARCNEPTPWSEWNKGVALPQGDCAHGLVCMGTPGLGNKAECHPDPALWNKAEAMGFWETSCRPGDCRPGSGCKQFFRDDGRLHFTQCRWGEEKGCMRIPGNKVGCDEECKDRTDCEPVHDGLVSIPDLTRSYHEELGNCVGAICSVWGDPHLVSCDNKKWDCQAEGLFTYMKNPLFDIQTHFVQLDTPMGHSASITNAVVVDNLMLADAPKIQFMFPPMESKETDVYPSESKKIGSCPVIMHIDDHMIDISGVDTYYYDRENEDMPPPQSQHILYEVPGVMKAWRVWWNLIMIEYNVNGETATIQIRSGGSGPHTGWSCIFSLFVCLPGAYEDMFKVVGASSGLAGTPNGNYRDDWVKWDGTVVEYGNRAKAFEFCTTEYCVGPLANKMAPAPGKTFNDYKCQDQEFHECTMAVLKNDLGHTDQTIETACKKKMADITDSSSCIVELCARGEALTDDEDDVDKMNENGNPEDPEDPEEVDDDCEDLGAFLSEATGAYAPPVPPAVATCNAKSAGHDQSHSVFVGKDYHCMQGIGMEGSLVVMDDLIVDSNDNGCQSFVTTSDGSCVHPEVGTRCIQVGDSITLGASSDQPLSIMQDCSTMACHTVYKGSCSISGSACADSVDELADEHVYTNGEMKQDTKLDLSEFATELTIIKQKQAYWSTWHPETCDEANGVIEIDADTEMMTLKAGADRACEQVFSMEASDFDGVSTLTFDASLVGKTILINVAGENPTITMPMMYDGSGYTGTGAANPFSPAMTQSILWNFFGSANGYVTLDGGIIQGSIITAGDLIYKAEAHLGRLIVHGSLVQDSPASVFLNYPFSPKCPLPLPPNTDDVCKVKPEPACVETTYRDMTSDEACPSGAEVVTLLGSKGVLPDAEPVIYGIEMIPADDGSPQVKFKIDNPFEGKSDIYVKYGKKAGNYGLDPECDKKFFVKGCDPNAYEEAEVVAGCSSHDGSTPYATVHVYFASKHNDFEKFGGEVDKCCHAPDYSSMYGYEVYEFSFEIKCECPEEETAQG